MGSSTPGCRELLQDRMIRNIRVNETSMRRQRAADAGNKLNIRIAPGRGRADSECAMCCINITEVRVKPGGIGNYGGDSSAWKQSLQIAWAGAGRGGGGDTGAALVDHSNRRGKVAAIWRMGNSNQGISREPGVGGGDGGRRRRYFQRSAANAGRTRGARGGDPRLPQHSEGT